MKEVGDGSGGNTADRLSQIIVYAAGPVAIAALWWLQDAGVVASTPIWLMAAIILGTGGINLLAAGALARRPDSTAMLQVRIAVSVLSTAAVIYAAGWGSVLLIGYALGTVELMRTTGPRSVRSNAAWNWVAILAGEIGVALGLLPTMIDVGLGHAIAITGGICLTIVTNVLGRTSRAAEAAEDDLRERGQFFQSLTEHAKDIIGVISAAGSVKEVSPAVLPMLGYTTDEVRGRPITRFLTPEMTEGLDSMLASVIANRGKSITVEITMRHRDGSPRVVLATLTSATHTDGDDDIIVNLHDMTTQRDLEEQLRRDARHDTLTGLLNRAAFGAVSERTCRRATRTGTTVGMLFIDLDGFKQVNDSFGHDVGDRVLVETAARLAGVLRSEETLARLGGDEFAVLIDSIDHHDQAIEVAERILAVVAAPIEGLPDDVRVGASIGIALRSPDGIEMSTLMRQADEAMYCAKRNGRSRWELSTAV